MVVSGRCIRVSTLEINVKLTKRMMLSAIGELFDPDGKKRENTIWQIHCFCDASERAYAAAVYIVLPVEEGVWSRLMVAKSKVAPIKVVSFPRLELNGAYLLVELIQYLLKGFMLVQRKSIAGPILRSSWHS